MKEGGVNAMTAKSGTTHGARACWRMLREGRPGRRFQSLHEQGQRRRSRWLAPVMMTVGGAIVVAGAVMLVMPGPGLAVMLFGALLIARYSLRMAKLLDKLELVGRRAYLAARRIWRSFSPGARVAFVIGVMATAGAAIAWTADRVFT